MKEPQIVGGRYLGDAEAVRLSPALEGYRAVYVHADASQDDPGEAWTEPVVAWCVYRVWVHSDDGVRAEWDRRLGGVSEGSGESGPLHICEESFPEDGIWHIGYLRPGEALEACLKRYALHSPLAQQVLDNFLKRNFVTN